MLEYTIEAATATNYMKVVSYIFMVILSILYAVLVIYLAIYAFRNPDPRHCYYIPGLDSPATTKSTVLILARDKDIAVKEGYPINIAHLFRAWFVWGFWGSVYQIVIFSVFIPLAFTCTYNLKLLLFSGAVAELLSCINTMVWLILGFFWRYSKGGSTVSGDKLEKVQGITDEEWKDALENAR